MSDDLARVAYLARFAGEKPRDLRPWDDLDDAARDVWRRVAGAVLAADGWNAPGGEPMDGRAIQVRADVVLRWKAYHPRSNEHRRGLKGRWQKLNEHGGWDTCDPPSAPWRIVPGR